MLPVTFQLHFFLLKQTQKANSIFSVPNGREHTKLQDAPSHPELAKEDTPGPRLPGQDKWLDQHELEARGLTKG